MQALQFPRAMVVGGGAAAQTAQHAHSLGMARPLIVSDAYLATSGALAAITTSFVAAGQDVPPIFSETMAEPDSRSIDHLVQAIHAGRHDGLIAVGGGSPIDSCKAAAVLASLGGHIRDYRVPYAIAHPLMPLIAVPTTAGTGSEVTRFTVITDSETGEKMLCAGASLMPSVALVDYHFTLTKPARLTADTGLDALTHAIEAYVSQKSGPFSDSLALAAMAAIYRHLPTAFARPGDHTARAALMLAATQAGMAFSNASVALVHGMSRPIGARFHVPHGLSNAMLLPTVTAYSLSGAPQRYADCAVAMGIAARDTPPAPAGEALVAALQKLNADMHVPTPAAFPIERAAYDAAIPEMVAQALASGSPQNNPRLPTADEMAALYAAAFGAAE